MTAIKTPVYDFLKELDRRDYRLHGMALIQHGETVFERAAAPYTVDTPHRLFSTAKSIYVLNFLFAVQEGLMKPEDRIAPLFPEYRVADPGLESITMDDLLTMRTGQEGDPFPLLFRDPDADLVEQFFGTPLADKRPGLKFRYNNTVPTVILAAVEKATGVPTAEWQRSHYTKKMNAPLLATFSRNGMYNPVITCASLHSVTEYARLFLNEGKLGEEQLVRPDLIRCAVSDHLSPGTTDAGEGYGWQIWRNRYGGYRMDGGWGQMVFAVPETASAVVLTSDMTDYSAAVEAYQKHLLPVLKTGEAWSEPTPELKSLAPEGFAEPAPELNHTLWKAEDGTAAELCFDGDRISFRLSGNGRNTVWTAGLNGAFIDNGGYVPRSFSIDYTAVGNDADTVLLSAAWRKPNVLRITGKCLAEMGEVSGEITFGQEECLVRRTPECVHGIAERQPEQMREVRLWRVPKNC